jgi:hypothetical protein
MNKQKMPTKKRTGKVDYDSAWKDIIEDLFSQFLEFFFPEIHKDIDFSKKCEFLSKELRKIVKDNKIGQRFADVLVKVHLKDGSIRCLFIHIEVQGYPDDDFPERMYVYNYRIYDRHRELNEEVISLAVLTDDDPEYRPEKYGVNRWRFDLSMTFPVVKILDYKERLAELEQSTNPMALVVAAQLKSSEAKKANIHTKYDVKLQLFKDCFKKGYSKDQIYILVKFIDWIINLPDKYQERLHDQLLILKEDNTMPYVTSWERIARKKALAEGIKKTKLATAKKMVKDKFPIDAVAKYTGLAEKEIKPLMQ